MSLDYVMFRRDDPRTPVPIYAFPIACDAIQQLMPVLREKITQSDTLRHKIFQVEFLSTQAGETLVTLIYHRKLLADWETEASALAAELGVALVGRSRKQKIVIGQNFVRESLTVNGRAFTYLQYEQAFTQPNAGVNTSMITWACERGASLTGDLLELYCGNGNFTAVLAQHFDQVLATEISKVSVNSALTNFAQNQIDNVKVVRMSSEEFTQALNGDRPFRRLADIDLQGYDFSTIFVDPPRAGLDSETEKLVCRFDNILYISCNPETLANNLSQITKTHSIESVAVFDQFPWTDHLESGVLLRRKN